MSTTATFTRLPGDARTAASTSLGLGDVAIESSLSFVSGFRQVAAEATILAGAMAEWRAATSSPRRRDPASATALTRVRDASRAVSLPLCVARRGGSVRVRGVVRQMADAAALCDRARAHGHCRRGARAGRRDPAREASAPSLVSRTTASCSRSTGSRSSKRSACRASRSACWATRRSRCSCWGSSGCCSAGARTARRCCTALLVVAGLVVLVPSFSLEDRTVQGLAWGLVSGFMFALLTVRSRRFSANVHALGDRFLAEPVRRDGAGAVRIASAGMRCRRSRFATRRLLVVLGVFCTALAHTLFIASLRRVSAHTASVVAALEPVYGIALAAWLLHEIPTLRTLVGAAMIVGRRDPCHRPTERMNAGLVASQFLMDSSMDIGIVGLGRMGGNMARRLARGGVRVVGFDPDPRVARRACGRRHDRGRRLRDRARACAAVRRASSG